MIKISFSGFVPPKAVMKLLSLPESTSQTDWEKTNRLLWKRNLMHLETSEIHFSSLIRIRQIIEGKTDIRNIK